METKEIIKITDNFYINGEKFQIISGTIHYFRVVPEYWRDRLEKLKAMGCNTVETYIAKYKEAVEHLRELQPDAVIYLQGIMKVTTERSEQGDYITNEGIEARNEEIAKLADNDHVFYLDVNPLICDETGGMEPSYTFDGVHLKAQYIPIWKDYLKEHAVDV